jgi:hypothetical protein
MGGIDGGVGRGGAEATSMACRANTSMVPCFNGGGVVAEATLMACDGVRPRQRFYGPHVIGEGGVAEAMSMACDGAALAYAIMALTLTGDEVLQRRRRLLKI